MPRRASTAPSPGASSASRASGWISCAMRGNGSRVEPVPGTDEQLLPPPGSLGALRPPALNVLLFLLTFASAFVAVAVLNDTQLPEPTRPAVRRHGIGVSAALHFIMLF